MMLPETPIPNHHQALLTIHSEKFFDDTSLIHPTERTHWIEGQPPEWNAVLLNDSPDAFLESYKNKDPTNQNVNIFEGSGVGGFPPGKSRQRGGCGGEAAPPPGKPAPGVAYYIPSTVAGVMANYMFKL